MYIHTHTQMCVYVCIFLHNCSCLGQVNHKEMCPLNQIGTSYHIKFGITIYSLL